MCAVEFIALSIFCILRNHAFNKQRMCKQHSSVGRLLAVAWRVYPGKPCYVSTQYHQQQRQQQRRQRQRQRKQQQQLASSFSHDACLLGSGCKHRLALFYDFILLSLLQMLMFTRMFSISQHSLLYCM
jgi:hypothetical protein